MTDIADRGRSIGAQARRRRSPGSTSARRRSASRSAIAAFPRTSAAGHQAPEVHRRCRSAAGRARTRQCRRGGHRPAAQHGRHRGAARPGDARLRAQHGEATDLPFAFWDERLSTVAAERTLIEMDVSRAKRRERLIDFGRRRLHPSGRARPGSLGRSAERLLRLPRRRHGPRRDAPADAGLPLGMPASSADLSLRRRNEDDPEDQEAVEDAGLGHHARDCGRVDAEHRCRRSGRRSRDGRG